MINKVIYAKSVEELNELIVKFNKEGWKVIQFYSSFDKLVLTRNATYYALLEKENVEWK